MFNFINESKKLLDAFEQLNDDQLNIFKEWLVSSNNSTEQDKINKILDIMNSEQKLQYTNNNISDDNYIKMVEDEKEKIRLEKLEQSDEILALIIEMENTKELYDYVSNLVNSLIRKKHRGVELDMDKLANSSIVADIIRRSIRSYERYGDKIYMTKELRKVAKKVFAKNILDLVDEWE